MKKEHTGYALVERTQKGMLFFQDAKRKRTYRMNKKSKKNLPLYGIGPVIVFGQLLIAGGAIAISYKFKWDCYEYEMLNIPLKIIGILSVIFGLYLNYSAKHISNLFENVSENRLIQDGIYGYVRNPVYSAAFFVSIGIVSMTNRLILLVAVGIICWSYMSILLVVTEEKWLRDLYGKQYEDYCNRVNRCIPWFRNKVL